MFENLKYQHRNPVDYWAQQAYMNKLDDDDSITQKDLLRAQYGIPNENLLSQGGSHYMGGNITIDPFKLDCASLQYP